MEKTLEKLLSGEMVRLNYWELTELLFHFPESINTLMIQKTSDCYCVVVDDISVLKEEIKEKEKGELLLKVAKAIDKEYGCAGCPFEDMCLAQTDEQCIGRIKTWLEYTTE